MYGTWNKLSSTTKLTASAAKNYENGNQTILILSVYVHLGIQACSSYYGNSLFMSQTGDLVVYCHSSQSRR